MDKAIQPEQLNLSFVEPVVDENAVKPPQNDGVGAIIYDFQSAIAKRKESDHASLYRQILDSVRHIG